MLGGTGRVMDKLPPDSVFNRAPNQVALSLSYVYDLYMSKNGIGPHHTDGYGCHMAVAADKGMGMARRRDPSATPAGAHWQHAHLKLPACLRLSDSPPHGAGVFAVAPLPRGLRLGPYVGCPVMADSTGADRYSWRVRHGRLVDTGNEAHSNWMRFVNCAPHGTHHNLVGFQYRGALYFHTVAPVAVGDELFIYYGDEYARNVDGCYDYRPPKEEPKPGFSATSSADEDSGNIVVDTDNSCDYGPVKEEPKSEFIDNHLLKEEPKPEPGDGGRDADDYDPPDAHGNCAYVLPKEDPELKVLDIYYHPLKEELELSDGDGDVDVNGYCDYPPPKEEQEQEHTDTGEADNCYYDCALPKEEPESELSARGDDAVTDGSQDVGYDCSHGRVNLCTQKFKVKHETRRKVRKKRKGSEAQITKSYHCRYCRCPFLSKERKEQHQRKYCLKRPGLARRRFDRTYFKCHKCKFVTRRKDSLARHLLTHNKKNAEWFTCTQCSFKSMHKCAMTMHMKTHENNFSCCCPICGKSFKRKPQLLGDHLLRQHPDKSDEVSKLITNKIHTSKICAKHKTTRKSEFKGHVTLTHNKGVGVGCQKYQCPRCPHFTSRKDNLNRHLKTHAKQKKQEDYRCAVCKKQFIRKRDLDSHIIYNHADNVDLVNTITSKLHCCDSCSFKTLEPIRLKRHVRSKHT